MPVSRQFGLVASILTLLSCLSLTRALADEFRIWTDITGKFKVEAQLVSVESDKAILNGRDGKRLAIPLAKLSEKDRGYLEAKMGENPFQVLSGTSPTPGASGVPSSPKPAAPASAAPAATEPAAPRELKVDFQAAAAQPVVKGSWSVKPDLFDGPPPIFKPLDLPGSKSDRPEPTHIASSPHAKRVVASFSPSDTRNATTRIVVVDTESGRVLGNASGAGRWQAMAIHDDGETLVVVNKTEGVPQGQLGTVRVRGSKLTPIDLWSPYETLAAENKEKAVTYAAFANDGKLVTVSQSGNVVVWNFALKEPLSRFDYHGANAPALSPNRKLLGFAGGDLVGFYDIDSGSMATVSDAPKMGWGLRSAFSPTGKRFAAASASMIRVWEVDTGEVVFEGGFDKLSAGRGLHFPDEDFLLLSNDFLVELTSRIKLWQFVGTNHMAEYGSTPVFGVNSTNGMRLIPTRLPTPEAAKMLDAARTQPDLFVWRKGVNVQLDVSPVPSQYQAEVSQGLEAQLKKMDCRVVPNAELTVQASIEGPKAEAVSYFFSGSFVFQQYTSKVQILYGGNPIWSTAITNVPGAISRGTREEMQQELDQAGQKPNLGVFTHVTFPELIQKPEPNSGGGLNRQTLGISRVTPAGLQRAQ